MEAAAILDENGYQLLCADRPCAPPPTAAPGRCAIIAGSFLLSDQEKTMGNKIVTEADRKASPAPTPAGGQVLRRSGTGQRISLERGVATRSKKNPGKRSHKGG
jgi:hypothetical protein